MLKKEICGVLGMAVLLTASASGVELRLKWEEGKRYAFLEEMSSAMTMQMGEAAMATKSELTQEIRYDVAAHESGTEVKLSFESMKMTVTMNGQQMMNFDSTAEDGAGGLGAMLKPLMNAKGSLIYDKDGKVVEVTGFDGLEGMEQMGMGKKELEQMASQASVLVPGKNVEPGATWSAEMDMPLGQLSQTDAVMGFEMKFEGMEKVDGRDLAKITIGGAVKMKEGGDAAPAIVLESKKVSGTMLFDVALGQPRETKMQMELEMGLPEGIAVQEGAPGKMPMSVMSTQTLKSVEDVKK